MAIRRRRTWSQPRRISYVLPGNELVNNIINSAAESIEKCKLTSKVLFQINHSRLSLGYIYLDDRVMGVYFHLNQAIENANRIIEEESHKWIESEGLTIIAYVQNGNNYSYKKLSQSGVISFKRQGANSEDGYVHKTWVKLPESKLKKQVFVNKHIDKKSTIERKRKTDEGN